jgi:hypothetical protein
VNENRPFLNDDEDDTLLFNKLEDYVLKNYPNPERIGCLNHATLETFVRAPEKLDLADPKYLHVLECAECTRELIELRRRRDDQEKQAIRATETLSVSGRTSRPRYSRWAALATAFAICVASVVGIFYLQNQQGIKTQQDAQEIVVSRTLDLSKAGALRGETIPKVALLLPRRIVALHVLLPYYSPGGRYQLTIVPDKQNGAARVEGTVLANNQGASSEINLTVDLRNLSPGTYHLALIREGDPSSSLYPLTIQ